MKRIIEKIKLLRQQRAYRKAMRYQAEIDEITKRMLEVRYDY